MHHCLVQWPRTLAALIGLLLAYAPAMPSVLAHAADDPWAKINPANQSIVFWHNHTRARQQALAAIVEAFNQTNAYNITVTQETQGNYGDIFRKMLGLLNTPDVPDLIVAYQSQAATYQLSASLLDMTSLLHSPRWGLTDAEKRDFFPTFLQQDIFPVFNNARLGIAPNRSVEMMYYNLDWLKELGYTTPPTTPEQFQAMACKAATTPFTKATAAGSMGYQLSLDASRLASWTFAFGGDVFDDHSKAYTYNSEATQKAMAFLQRLSKAGCATAVTERDGDTADFGTGRLLFTVGSTSGLPFYKAAVDAGARFDWSIAPLPRTTSDPVINVYGASVSMPKTTPERELATWLFVKYFTSPPVQADWGRASNYFPVRQSAAVRLQDYFQQNLAYKTAFDLLQYTKSEPRVPGYDFVRTLAEEAMAAIFAHSREVQQTLQRLNEEANERLAEQMQSLPSSETKPGKR
jgi:multiple sugar transport system substrate-binding protein/sn-glycerol 3-phosphate transport system substrate-binding protein